MYSGSVGMDDHAADVEPTEGAAGAAGGAAAAAAAEAAAVWTACHPDVDLTEGRTLVTRSRGPESEYRSAVCGEAAHAMGGSGGGGGRRLYYAEFAVVEMKNYIAVGVVPAGAAGRAPQEMKGGWCNRPAAHMWASWNGGHYQGNSPSPWPSAGRTCYRRGDTVGLLLDVEGGTLTAFKNGARLGVVVPNEKVPSLGDGPFHWAVDLMSTGDSVRINATKPPPPAGAPTVATAAAKVPNLQPPLQLASEPEPEPELELEEPPSIPEAVTPHVHASHSSHADDDAPAAPAAAVSPAAAAASSREDIEGWGVEDVCEWLVSLKLPPPVVEKFREKEVRQHTAHCTPHTAHRTPRVLPVY